MTKAIVVRQGKENADNEYWRSFPPFLWLLRDVLVHMPEKNGKEVTPTEYLTTEVLHGDGSDDKESVGATVNKALTTFFPTFECKTLPPPSTSREMMAKVSESQDKLDPEFKKGVNELVDFLKMSVKPKRVFNATGAVCDGATIALLVKEVAKAVNNPHSIPPLDNTWKLVVQSRCQTVQETLLEEYCTTMKTQYDKLSRGGPINECVDPGHENSASVMGIHNTLWSEMRKRLLNDVGPLLSSETTGNVTLESVTEELVRQLIQYQEETDPHTHSVRKVVGGAIFPIVEENRRRSWEFCNKLFTDLYTPITERVTAGDDEYTSDNLSTDIKNLLQEYDARSIGPEKWHVRATIVTTIKQNEKLLKKHLQEVLKHAEMERKAKEMQESLRSELQSLNDSRRELDEKFTEFAEQQKEAEERRRQEIETEVKELKERIKEQEEREKEMHETEMKRRIQEAQKLAEETFKKEMAQERLKDTKKTMQKNQEQENERKAKADEEYKKLEQTLKDKETKEKNRKAKAQEEMDELKAEIQRWEKKLKQKEIDEAKYRTEATKEIRKAKESLHQHQAKEAEAAVQYERKLREKESELHDQQLQLQRMKSEHEFEVYKIEEEREEERRQREIIEESTRITIERLNQLVEDEKSEREQKTKEWEEVLSAKSKEEKKLKKRIYNLTDRYDNLTDKYNTERDRHEDLREDVHKFQEKGWVSFFGIKVTDEKKLR